MLAKYRSPILLILSALMLSICGQALAADKPHIVFVIGENPYGTKDSIPVFAKEFLQDFRCSFVHVDENDPNHFPGLEKLKNADLLVLSVRRRTPSKAQMTLIKKHLDAGKPMVGIRTASHAFGAKPPSGDHVAWDTFDVDVIGAEYRMAYPDHPETFIELSPAVAGHPVLKGVPPGEIRVTSHLYKYRNLPTTSLPLAYGRVAGNSRREPIAWTNTAHNRRVFYTSLGNEQDFQLQFFQRLLFNGINWSLNRPAAK